MTKDDGECLGMTAMTGMTRDDEVLLGLLGMTNED